MPPQARHSDLALKQEGDWRTNVKLKSEIPVQSQMVIFVRKCWRSVVNFSRDLVDRGANECVHEDLQALTLTWFLGVLVPTLVAVTAIPNSLVPTFAKFVDFKVRSLAAILLMVLALAIVAFIITAKQRVNSDIVGLERKYYSHRKRERIIAKVSLLLILVCLTISVAGMKLWFGRTGGIEGQVVGPDGRPMRGVVIDFYNPDGVPVTEKADTTDYRGVFVLYLHPKNGRGVRFTVESADGPCFPSVDPSVEQIDLAIARAEHKEEGGISDATEDPGIVLRVSCTSH